VSTVSRAGADWAPPAARPLVQAAIAAARADPRIVGGSAATGTMDEYSDLDFVVVCRDERQAELLREAPAFAAGLGPLLACFTGEHVGEPRLLIALYGPPPLHVRGCLAALRAAVDLYRRLRGGAAGLERRASVEVASLAYLDEIEARVGTP
jgi:hypothetical protein